MSTFFEFIQERRFVTAHQIDELTADFIRYFQDKPPISQLENVRELKLSDVMANTLLDSLRQNIEAYYRDILGFENIEFGKLWFVRSEAKHTDQTKLPYLPHFDRHRYLKAMVYLHDVDGRHGPIQFGKLADPKSIDLRRKSLPADYKALGLNIIDRKDLVTSMAPVVGSAGDVIFFDTNAAHCAGVVAKGYERRVLRFDFEVAGHNEKPSVLQKIAKRFFA